MKTSSFPSSALKCCRPVQCVHTSCRGDGTRTPAEQSSSCAVNTWGGSASLIHAVSELLQASPYVTACICHTAQHTCGFLRRLCLTSLYVIGNCVLAAAGCGHTRGMTPSRVLAIWRSCPLPVHFDVSCCVGRFLPVCLRI